MNYKKVSASLGEVHGSVDTTNLSKPVWKRALAYFGPAYLVSVGYMDPGNWATDLAGGSQFGYTLIWVLLMSNLMALLLQNLSARLGIVYGKDLAQVSRETYPPYINFCLYLLAEVAIAATDLAEVLGMAIGIQLLSGIPLLWAVLVTVLDTFLLLALQRLGMRKMELFIVSLVAIIGTAFLIEIILAKPDLAEVATGFIPHLPNREALYIAIGIIGATVMPHNLYLHSALVQTRKIKRDDAGIKKALRFSFADSAVALNLAFLVNAAILVLAATVFFKTGRTDVAEIRTAYELLSGFLSSKLAPVLFAVALIAAGQSSTITGTLAGQIVMEGYLRLRINPLVRRLITRLIAIVPAVIVILISGEKNINQLLILSQVILSLQLGFAVIPLIHFVSDKKIMKAFTIRPFVQLLAWTVAGLLVYLNIKMIGQQSSEFFLQSHSLFWKSIFFIGSGIFLLLLIITIFYPLLYRTAKDIPIQVHPAATDALPETITAPQYNCIAVALDFSRHDQQLLAHAIAQADVHTRVVLIHIVESASARMLGGEADDFETRKDQQRLDEYVEKLTAKNRKAMGILGFKNRTKEIVRLIKEADADLLIIGAHGHRGIKDWLYGTTIDAVRHRLKIPVLIIRA